jgi:hypothetical protein
MKLHTYGEKRDTGQTYGLWAIAELTLVNAAELMMETLPFVVVCKAILNGVRVGVTKSSMMP